MCMVLKFGHTESLGLISAVRVIIFSTKSTRRSPMLIILQEKYATESSSKQIMLLPEYIASGKLTLLLESTNYKNLPKRKSWNLGLNFAKE